MLAFACDHEPVAYGQTFTLHSLAAIDEKLILKLKGLQLTAL